MGQTIGRDLGLQESEEEAEKNKRIQNIINEVIKKKTNTNQSMSQQPSRFMSQDVEEEEDEDDLDDDDDDDDEDDDEMSIDDSYSNQPHKKGIISSDSSRIESKQPSGRPSQQQLKMEGGNNPYSRPFQSIKIDKLFIHQDENEEEEHEQDMLNDMSDDEDMSMYDNNPKPLSKQNSHEKTKKIHNIRDEVGTNNQSQGQNGTRNTANENPQIKFQSVFNKDFDFNLQSESEQSQFGIVFSSDDEENQQSVQSERIRSGLLDVPGRATVDKIKLDDEEDSKLKSPGTLHKTQSGRGTSVKTRPLQSFKSGGKPSSHFFPSQRKTQQPDSVKKDYNKYLTEFFPDRKSQRPDL